MSYSKPRAIDSVDHLRLITDRGYLDRVAANLDPGRGAVSMRVEHENDDSCCQCESWEKTLSRLILRAREL